MQTKDGQAADPTASSADQERAGELVSLRLPAERELLIATGLRVLMTLPESDLRCAVHGLVVAEFGLLDDGRRGEGLEELPDPQEDPTTGLGVDPGQHPQQVGRLRVVVPRDRQPE